MKSVENLTLWAPGVPYPAQSEMEFAPGMTHILAHDGRTDILPFLHDVTITAHEGRIYIAWYNSTDAEICGSSLIRGRWSDDEGATWSEPFTVVGRIDSAEEHFVPANLFEHNGRLHATITEMTGKNMTAALHLFRKEAGRGVGDPGGDEWERVGQIQHGFICNTPPVELPDGGLISPAWMPMKNGTPAFPAVLISRGAGGSGGSEGGEAAGSLAAEWEPVLLYDPLSPLSPRIRCPETTLRVEPDGRVLAFVRNDQGPAWVFESRDCGRSWAPGAHFAPMAVGNSKIFAGELSDGRRYLIYNEDKGYFERSLLVIALSEPGAAHYSRVYKLFEDVDEVLGRGSKWFYPCAVESDGALYVACTLQEPTDHRSAVIARLQL